MSESSEPPPERRRVSLRGGEFETEIVEAGDGQPVLYLHGEWGLQWDAFLASLLNQTCRDFEIIVADNCSSDETPQIVHSFADPRLRYHRHDRNIGPFANMNYLIDQARGAYICIVHDDDLYGPEFLERESALMEEARALGSCHLWMIAWNLPDPMGRSLEEVRTIRDDIARRVEELADELDDAGNPTP